MLPGGWIPWFWYKLGHVFFALFFILFYSLRYFGQKHVPPSGPFLVVSNHESFWDPPLVGVSVGRRVTYMARKTLFKNKIGAYLMSQVGTFAVDQEGTGLDGIRMAIKQLEAGRGVVVFPEGTRTPDGQIQEFMAGIALLIRKAKVPVLPVAIGGAYDAWAIHARRPRFAPIWMSPRKHSLAVVVGPLIPAETLLGMEPKRMVEYLREVIWHLRKEAYRRKRLPSEAK